MTATDEERKKDLNNRIDYLIQQVLTLKKGVDSFMDKIERKDKGTNEYCRKKTTSKIKILPEPKTVVVDQDGEEYT